MPPTRIDVSVIVPTFNRSARLLRLIADLCHQSVVDGYEVIVVDNNSTDDTRVRVAEVIEQAPLVRYVFEPEAGASRARNRGIAVARGAILAFVDDDVRVAPDWIEAVRGAFERDASVDCIGGRVEPRWPLPPPPWLTPAHWPPLALQIGRGQAKYLDRDHASACLVTANFACRASVFDEIGGFSPAFVRDEDREFNLRMWRAGKRGAYEDGVVAYAEVQPERLEKPHHRRWYGVTGASHARLRYREIIDHDGRLRDLTDARGRYVFGAPGFLYRELATHVVRWARLVARFRIDDAFLDECRIRYLLAYLATRWRDWIRSLAPTAPRRAAA